MTREQLIITCDALLAIEDALQKPLFFGLPIGTTLNDRLITKLANGYRCWNWKSAARDHLRYHYHRMVPTVKSSRDFSHFAGRLCVTWLFDRFDLKGFVLPLLEAYGPGNAFVAGAETSMVAQLPAETNFMLLNELPGISLNIWRREFNRCSPVWRRSITEVLEAHRIPRYVIPYLMDSLQIQTQRIMASGSFLDQARPSAIVTEYDRNEYASCLILAAKERSIPTMTMIHGALDPYPSFGFVPLLADYACCWGERHRAQMLELGAHPDNLLVTGCQRLTRELDANRQEARAKADLPVDRPVVMLITNPIMPEHKKRYAEVFCSGMSNVDQAISVVRLHPAEHLNDYQELIGRFPSVRFLSNKTWTQDEALAASDVVVNHDSSFGNDALVKGRLVVVMDVLPLPLKNGKELVEMAGCPCVRNAEELKEVVETILSNKKMQNELHLKAEQYVRLYSDAFGDEAAKNIIKVITNSINNNANILRSNI